LVIFFAFKLFVLPSLVVEVLGGPLHARA